MTEKEAERAEREARETARRVDAARAILDRAGEGRKWTGPDTGNVPLGGHGRRPKG